MNREAVIEIAERIGAELIRNAVWDADRCNWLTPVNDLFGGTMMSGFGMSGPNLYDGTAGIGLFLGQLHRVTGDPVAGATAAAALTHALSRLDDIPRRLVFGFHTGHVGISYAAIRTGLALGRRELVEQGVDLARRVLAHDDRDACVLDVMMGFGGAIPALLALADDVDIPGLPERLIDWAERLLSEACFDDRGASWNTAREMLASLPEDGGDALSWFSRHGAGQANLLGYAHGACGIGLALLEMGAATGQKKFLNAGHAAMAYENSWFDERRGVWPDLRHNCGAAGVCETAWCHGSVGIGLSRRRAWRLTGLHDYRRDLERAMSNVARHIRASLRPDANHCLCHGVLGDVEIFLDKDDCRSPETEDIVDEVLEFGHRTFHRADRPWPYGAQCTEMPPGMMLGAAGTGYFHLRVADPDGTPSILAPAPRNSTLRPDIEPTLRAPCLKTAPPSEIPMLN